MSKFYVSAKNLCCMYFHFSNKRSADFDDLMQYRSHLGGGLRKELGVDVTMDVSDYHFKQMCYDYDDLFDMTEDKIIMKKNVPHDEMKSQLGYMSLALIVPCTKISQDYFAHIHSRDSVVAGAMVL